MHNLDYNNVPTFPQGLKSLFRVGQGMIDAAEEEAAEKRAAAAKPEGEAPIASEISPESEAENAASQQIDAVPTARNA